MTNEELLLTVEEAARRIKFSRSKTYQLVADGEIPSIQVGSQRRIPIAALAQWLARKVEESK